MILLLQLSKHSKQPKVWEKEKRWGRNVGMSHLTTAFHIKSTCSLKIIHFTGRHRSWIKQTGHTIARWLCALCHDSDRFRPCKDEFIALIKFIKGMYTEKFAQLSHLCPFTDFMNILASWHSSDNMCHFAEQLQYSSNVRAPSELLLINSN